MRPVTDSLGNHPMVSIANLTALETTIVGSQPGQIRITCVATDARGATATATATITIRHPNRPPTVQTECAGSRIALDRR